MAPRPPQNDRSQIQNASDVICPQAYPKWLTTGAVTPFTPSDIPPVDPRTSEDCLFLDVLMPTDVWKTRTKKAVPVLVWIFGGGFDIGWKDASGRGYGLVTRSSQLGREGVILVSLNYRLGLFVSSIFSIPICITQRRGTMQKLTCVPQGWMHGAGVQSNAGLLDQRFALEWVQKYISLFGGDPSKVTILGESAGASGVEAHITAYGGSKGRNPFKGAIAQSPYIAPAPPLPNSLVSAVLNFANVSSVTSLRNMTSAGLQRLNALLVGNSQPFGTFTFGDLLFCPVLRIYSTESSPGVVPDGDYVPDIPGKLMRNGQFDRTLSVMTGHNQDEGSRFIPSTLVIDEPTYVAFLKSLLSAPGNVLDSIAQNLYPPVFDGSQGYTTQTERNNLTIADAAFVCNARYMDDANFIYPTYAYEFSAGGAVHGADLAYTFYDFDTTNDINTTLAQIMQHYLIQFTQNGQPNGAGLPLFPAAKPGLTVQNLGNDFVGPMLDEKGVDQLSRRCDYWQTLPQPSSKVTLADSEDTGSEVAISTTTI